MCTLSRRVSLRTEGDSVQGGPLQGGGGRGAVDAGVFSAQGSASTAGRADQVPGDALRAVSFMLFRGWSNPGVCLKSQRGQRHLIQNYQACIKTGIYDPYRHTLEMLWVQFKTTTIKQMS